MYRKTYRLNEVQNSIKTMDEANLLNATLRYELSKLGYVLSRKPGHQTEYDKGAKSTETIHVDLYSRRVYKAADVDVSSMYPSVFSTRTSSYIFRLLTNEELLVFDKLGFELSEEHISATGQNIEDWFNE